LCNSLTMTARLEWRLRSLQSSLFILPVRVKNE